jgi:hypothetical protein
VLTQGEFEAILCDASKRIIESISWCEDEDHSPSVEFRAEIASDAGHPLMVRGSFNRMAKTLTFALIHRQAGRVYALDMGKGHRNPDGTFFDGTHKHRWNEKHRDREAYEPDDITADVLRPVDVWQQFCTESKITCESVMQDPPAVQPELFL